MRVLLITNQSEPYMHNSRYTAYIRIAPYLNRMHDVDILTWKFRKVDKKIDEGLNVHRVFAPPTDILLEGRLKISLSGYFRSGNYDVTHALHSISGFFPSFRYQTVVTVHITSDLDPNNIWLKYKTMLQKIIFKKASYIICVSTNLLSILKKKYNVKNVIYIPLGVDINHFTPDLDVTNLRENLLEDKYNYLVLCTGIHGTKKDVILKLAKRFPSIKFITIGIPDIQQTPANMGAISRVSENGLREHYAASDLVFRPLRFATANCTVLEAMAMGKPMITDAIPGVLDYLNDDCAYLARNRNYEEQFNLAIKDENERKMRGIAARKRAEKEFSYEIVAKKVSAIYEQVIK